jgi:hypothetical protein
MIKPTNGRVVWFTPSPASSVIVQIEKTVPLAAIVTHVYGDRMVNLVVFDSYGAPHSKSSVPLLQDGDERPEHGNYCEWMPYQKGQAAKTEAAEKAAS